MADGMSHLQPWQMLRPLYIVPGCYTEHVEYCGRYSTTFCHLMTRMLFFPYFLNMPPIQPQDYLPMVIEWTPFTRHIPCQVQPGAAHKPYAP